MDHLLSLLGWDYLTPQGLRFGIATILSLIALTPNRSSGFEVLGNLIFNAGAAIMVAQAVSIAH